MNRYIAFLRGINVGGNNIIKMADLTGMFESAGLSNVRTYIQSGNVLFESMEKNPEKLRESLENHLEGILGKRITVILRRHEEIETIIAMDPFKGQEWGTETKYYVCFLDRKPVIDISLPFKNEKEGLVLIQITDKDAFLVSLPIKDHFGFPNPYIEKEFKVLSTARNWTTVTKIVSR